MKNKKGSIFITSVAAIIGLVGYIFLQFRCYELIGIYGGTIFLSDLRQFGIVITSGLLTGALLTLAISISEYKTERTEALESIYFAAEDLEREFSKIKYFLPDEPKELVHDVLGELDNNERHMRFNKELAEVALKSKNQQEADEVYNRNCAKLNYDAQNTFRDYIWENTDEETREICTEPFQIKEYLDQECEKRIKKYVEQLEDTMKSFLRFQEVRTNILTATYKKIDFIFANKSIRYRIYENLYCKLVKEVNLIKQENLYFKRYFDGEQGNKAVLCSIIWELQNSLLSEDENAYYRQFDFDLTTEMVRILVDAKGKIDSKRFLKLNKFIKKEINRKNRSKLNKYVKKKNNSAEFPKLKEYGLKHKPGYFERLNKQWEEDNQKNNKEEISNKTEMKT